MGVKGLLTYILEKRDQCVQEVDLVEVARQRQGIELLVDFYSFEHLIQRKLWKSLTAITNNKFLRISGGEYGILDAHLTKLIKDLQSLDIHLVMFIDGCKGSSEIGTEQKLQTWKFRHHNSVQNIYDLLSVCKGEKSMEDLDEQTSVRPVLLEVQVRRTLQECNCEIIQCAAGEADYVIAEALKFRPRAYAVVSNDTDFGIFRDCVFIPNELFDTKEDLRLGYPQPFTEKPIRLMVGVVSSSQLCSLCGFQDASQLIELSIIAGNDFTGPYLKNIKRKLNFSGYIALQTYIDWVRQYRQIENNHIIHGEMQTNRKFSDAVRRTREFYNLKMPPDKVQHKGPLSDFIEDAVQHGELPANVVGIHMNFYWHRMLLEDIAYGHPCSEVAMTGLRRYVYGMLLPRNEKVVVEYGRTPYEELATTPVYSIVERGIVTADYIDSKKIFQNLRTFHRIMTHLEPDFDMKFFDRYGRKNGFICYVLRYFLVVNTGSNMYIGMDEFLPCLAVAFCHVDEPWYESIGLLPTTRCLTLGNWFQNVYRHAYSFLGKILHLTHEFPQPKEIFSGAVWTAFYMVSRHEAMLIGPAQFPRDMLHRIQHEMDQVIREKRHMIRYIVKDIFDFNDRF